MKAEPETEDLFGDAGADYVLQPRAAAPDRAQDASYFDQPESYADLPALPTGGLGCRLHLFASCMIVADREAQGDGVRFCHSMSSCGLFLGRVTAGGDTPQPVSMLRRHVCMHGRALSLLLHVRHSRG